nr:unnamed protein product [Digitaria exilis]
MLLPNPQSRIPSAQNGSRQRGAAIDSAAVGPSTEAGAKRQLGSRPSRQRRWRGCRLREPLRRQKRVHGGAPRFALWAVGIAPPMSVLFRRRARWAELEIAAANAEARLGRFAPGIPAGRTD